MQSSPVDIEIISKEMIKPSNPTPNHLTNFKCSFLDQIAPSHYLPFILLYHTQEENINHRSEIIQKLKTSLSNTLTHFYILSGKLSEDGFSIQCDDQGVVFLDARLNCKLSEVIVKADYNVLNQCLPDQEAYARDYVNRKVLVAVQFNTFSCGGIGIGMYVSHKAGDGHSATTFLKSWASSCQLGVAGKSDPHVILPKLDAANYFPPTDVTRYKPVIEIPPEANLIAKRFVFSRSGIDGLAETVLSPALNDVPPSSVTQSELISAFILKRVMAIRESKLPKRLVASLYYVNLRDKMNPPLPKESFGNLWRIGLAPPTILNEESYDVLISKQRKAIDRVASDDYIRNLKNGKDQRMDIFLWATRKGSENTNIDSFIFTSWLDFPLYDLDFGFGKPAYVCSPSRPRRNMITLMNTREGDGVEVWVNMTKEDMAAFESDLELLSLTSK